MLRKKLIALSLSLIGLPAGAAEFIPLGDLAGGDYWSRALDTSGDGTTVVGYSRSSQGLEAFRWNSIEGMSGLGDLPGDPFDSRAFAASADGSAIVGSGKTDTLNTEAYRWSAGAGMEGLGDLPGGSYFSTAQGISADGNVVVGYSSGWFGPEAMRWTALDGMVGLGDLGGGNFSSHATAVSADGAVVAGDAETAAGTEAFIWTSSGGMVGLGELPGGAHYSDANSISADGTVIVGRSQTGVGYQAFRWDSTNGMDGLGFLPSAVEVESSSSAQDVSADGSLIVGSGTTWIDGLSTAFIWHAESGMQALHEVLAAQDTTGLDGWTLWAATGISDDGSIIVGYGTNPQGNFEAWMVTGVEIPTVAPPPAPRLYYTHHRINSGHWDFQRMWNTSATGSINFLAYDNGETGPMPIWGLPDPPLPWSPQNPDTQTGTFGGILITDDSDVVIGGSLRVSGNIANQLVIGGNSWWAHEYTDLVIDFENGTAESSYQCFETVLAPAGCDGGGARPADSTFTPISGNEGSGGAARHGAIFDGATLTIFREGFNGTAGSDLENSFNLDVSTLAQPRPLGGITDISGDAVADFFFLKQASARPRLYLHSGTDGTLVRTIDYFDDSWRAIASDVLSDTNGDGVANDPAILMLAESTLHGRTQVEIRSPISGAEVLPGLQVLNKNWNVVATAIVSDADNSGVSDDPAIAVLAAKKGGGRNIIEVNQLSDGAVLARWGIYPATWLIKDIVAMKTDSGDAVIAVLGTDPVTGVSRIKTRRLADGLQSSAFAFGNQVETIALSVISDSDGNGVHNDYALVVLGRKNNGNHIARVIGGSPLTKIKDIRMTGGSWLLDDLAVMPDLNGNGFDELAGIGRGVSENAVLLKVRDFASGATLLNLYP